LEFQILEQSQMKSSILSCKKGWMAVFIFKTQYTKPLMILRIDPLLYRSSERISFSPLELLTQLEPTLIKLIRHTILQLHNVNIS
jgi:hypothetical protein